MYFVWVRSYAYHDHSVTEAAGPVAGPVFPIQLGKKNHRRVRRRLDVHSGFSGVQARTMWEGATMHPSKSQPVMVFTTIDRPDVQPNQSDHIATTQLRTGTHLEFRRFDLHRQITYRVMLCRL